MNIVPFKKILAASLLLAISFSSISEVSASLTTEPEFRHYTLFHMISDALPQLHYSKERIGNDISHRWVDNLIMMIDPERNLLSQDIYKKIVLIDNIKELSEKINSVDLEYLFYLVSVLYESKQDSLETKYRMAKDLDEDTFLRQQHYRNHTRQSIRNSIPINRMHRDELFRRNILHRINQQMKENKSFDDAKYTLIKEIENRVRIVIEKRKDSEYYFFLITQAFLQAYDAHSRYISPEDLVSVKAAQKNEEHGLGVKFSSDEGFLKIVDVDSKHPLVVSQTFKVGDIIKSLSIDGNDYPLKGKTSYYLSKVISQRRSEGFPLHLKYERRGATYSATVTLENIKKEGISIKKYTSPYELRSSQVMTIPSFFEGAYEQVKMEMSQYDGTHLTIDLRGNGGGSLYEAIKITSLFMNEGLILSMKDGDSEKKFFDTDDIFYDVKLIILVDRTTASAAELMASALQYHNQAVIIGEGTYGKGTVQQFIDFTESAYGLPYSHDYLGGMLITIAEYFTPDGKSIQGIGVIPDISIGQQIATANIKATNGNHALLQDDSSHWSVALLNSVQKLMEVSPLYIAYNQSPPIPSISSMYSENQISYSDWILGYINLNRRHQGLVPIHGINDIEEGYDPVDIPLDITTHGLSMINSTNIEQ